MKTTGETLREGGLVPGFWDELAVALADPDCFAALWELDPYELLRAWAALEDNSPHRVIVAYPAALARAGEGLAYGPGLADLWRYRVLDEPVDALLSGLVAKARRDEDARQLQARLGDYVRSSCSKQVGEANDERLEICRTQIGNRRSP